MNTTTQEQEQDFFLGDKVSAIYGGKRRTGKLTAFGATGWCTVTTDESFELYGTTRDGFALSPEDRGSMRLIERGKMADETVVAFPVHIGGAHLA